MAVVFDLQRQALDIFGNVAGARFLLIFKNKQRFFLQTEMLSCTVVRAGGLAQLVRASA